MAKIVIICAPFKGCVHKALKHLKGKNFQWAYFGEDISKAIAIEQQLGNKGHRIEIAAKLQETARSLRQPYIDFIGKLSLENNSLMWWAGSLSEKNPFISKVFLYACYIKVCKSILNSKNQKECIVFLVENSALRQCIIQNLSIFSAYDLHRVESLPYTIFEIFRDVFRAIIHKGGFVANTMYRMLLAKYYRLNRISSKRGELVLIHTWVDKRSFDANNEYHESYFGELAHHLRNKGRNVALVPYVLGTVSYRKTLKKMVQSDENFLVPQAFLNVYDILHIAAKTMLGIPPKRVYPLFEGVEISKIISVDYKRDWIGIRTSIDSLLYDVVRHWKNAGIPIDTFIYPYENHTWEKVYCTALRQFYPSTYIIGYQHSTVRNMLLNYFFSSDEMPILPFPDKVVTNGKYPERLFKESGYDAKKVICGGAIRYAHLQDEARKNTVISFKENNTHPIILVTPSIGQSEAAELVWKVLKAFEHRDNYKITIKCHPVMPYHRIAKYLGVKSLPPRFIISDKPVSELLKESSVLLYTDSTTCIEALSAGIPSIHISSDFIIDQDPLDFRPDVKMNACAPEDIVNCVKNTLELNEETLHEKRKQWSQVSSEVFGTVDDSIYDLFIQSKI